MDNDFGENNYNSIFVLELIFYLIIYTYIYILIYFYKGIGAYIKFHFYEQCNKIDDEISMGAANNWNTWVHSIFYAL